MSLRSCFSASRLVRLAELSSALLLVDCAGSASTPGVEEADAGAVWACNAMPKACLSAPSMLLDPHLSHESQAFSAYPAADTYAHPGQAGCENEYVVEMTPADLGGQVLMAEVYWSGLSVPLTNMGLRCDQYSGFVQAYDRADENSLWKLINYRTFSAEANSEGSVCQPVLVASGTDDPEFVFPEPTPRMWFTPSRHPGGIRVVAGMYRDCEPLTLDVTLSEEFP